MKIILGLGNPGDRYAATRHNIGWMVLDAIATEGGKIDASDVGLTPESSEQEQRLMHGSATTSGVARVTLRNLRGGIVVAKAK